MCWIPLVMGGVMTLLGALLILRFFLGRGQRRYQLASVGRTESMVLGVVLMTLGFLLLVLGGTGVICDWGGWG